MMMLAYLLLALGAVAVVHGGEQGRTGNPGVAGAAGVAANPYPRSVTKVLTVENGGFFGEWEEAVFCPKKTFATGFQLYGSFSWVRGDNTALNRIALKCKSADNSRETIVPAENERSGNLEGMNNCTKLGSTVFYLNAFQLHVDQRYDGFTGAGRRDYTGATEIDFKCRPESFPLDYTLSGDGAKWGTAGGWSASCPIGSSICGMQHKVQENQGWNVDDSSLNDIKFFCCKHSDCGGGHQGGCPGRLGEAGLL